jgi:hypothetical protein
VIPETAGPEVGFGPGLAGLGLGVGFRGKEVAADGLAKLP